MNNYSIKCWLALDEGTKVVINDCELKDYAPEVELLYAIIDDYAQNQQNWFNGFVTVVHKISINGYSCLTTNELNFNQFLWMNEKLK